MNFFLRLICLCLLPMLLVAGAALADDEYLEALAAERLESSARIELRTHNLLTPDLIDAIRSGLVVEYQYELRIMRARALWLDAEDRVLRITKRIEYDALRRLYSVRTLNGTAREREYRQADVALADFVTSGEIQVEPLGSQQYIRARARLSEFDNWFPINLIVSSLASWEFETPELLLLAP